VHGGSIISARAMNYLIIKTFPTRIELELKRMADAVNLVSGTTMWQADRNAPAKIAFTRGATSVGTMTIDKVGPRPTLKHGTGLFTEYVP
jgi:hypothetical protein